MPSRPSPPGPAPRSFQGPRPTTAYPSMAAVSKAGSGAEADLPLQVSNLDRVHRHRAKLVDRDRGRLRSAPVTSTVPGGETGRAGVVVTAAPVGAVAAGPQPDTGANARSPSRPGESVDISGSANVGMYKGYSPQGPRWPAVGLSCDRRWVRAGREDVSSPCPSVSIEVWFAGFQFPISVPAGDDHGGGATFGSRRGERGGTQAERHVVEALRWAES